jgi:uncharacterized repeat protein (TIGR01451 family)
MAVLLAVMVSFIGLATQWDHADALAIGTYDQCSNDDGDGYATGNTECRWINGNLNANNSTYAEGEATVQRLVLTDLAPGSVHTVTLQYGTTKGGKHAYDYLVSWDYSEDYADLCDGIAGCAGWPIDTIAIPKDPNSAFTAEDPDVVQADGVFTFGNAAPTAVSAYSVSGSYAGDSETSLTITFQVGSDADACVTKQGNTTCSVALWFGAHIALTEEWTTGGATTVSGSPYHVSLSNLDGASIGQRDNQMQANTIISDPDVSVLKTADNSPINAGETAAFTITVDNIGLGTATAVTLTDPLPAGIVWSEDSTFCTIDTAPSPDVLNCSFGDIAPDAAAIVIHLTGTTPFAACSTITNTATVSATNEPADVLANNTSTATINCNTGNIEVHKTANPAGPVSAGDTIGFDLIVHNHGTGSATNVVLTDVLPTTAGLNWSVDAFGGCAIASGTLTCNLGTIAGGGTVGPIHISSSTTAATCGLVSNTASVATGNDGSDTDSASVTVNCPNISIVKTPDGGTLSAGGTLSFSIVVSNAGPGNATNVTLSDQLPAGFTWTENPDNLDCSISAGGLLSCSFGDIASGASETITVEAPTGATCGLVSNPVATADADNDDAVNDAGDITINCPTLSVVKTPDGGTVNAGDNASFTITVTNDGPGTAIDVVLDDTLPAGLTWTDDSALCSVTGGNVLHCDFGNLAQGANASVTVTAPTTENTCGLQDNPAAIADADNTASAQNDGDLTIDCPELDVDKIPDAGNVDAGGTLSFTITVTNLGPGTANSVTLHDVLPGAYAWTIDPANAACAIVAGVLDCNFGNLAPNGTGSVTVTAPTGATCGNVSNPIATADASNAAPVNDAGDITINCPGLSVVKTPDAGVVNAGDNASFTITVTNNGPGTAFNVVLDDNLPAALTWTDDSALCTITGDALHCDFGNLAQGANASVTVTAPTTENTCGLQDNPAAIADADNTASAQDDGDLTINCPVLDIAKLPDSGDVNAGGTLSFSITVTNLGPGTANSVTLHDVLPGAYTWTINPANAACEIVAGVLDCNFGNLAAGATRTVTVEAPTGATCGNVSNPVAYADATNAAGVQDPGDIDIACPELSVAKTPDSGSVTAGDNASFTITVTNDGPGTAFNVVLDDDLPAALTWTDDSALCTITGDALHCDFGNLADGASASVTVTAPTSFSTCGLQDNPVAIADADNADSAQDDGDITVNCPTGNLFHTGTTCQQFQGTQPPSGLSGTAISELLYGVKSGKINNVAPGVFFYYGEATNTVTVTQSVDNGGTLFTTHQSQILVYDLDCNKLKANQFSASVAANGTIIITSAGDFVFSIKYSTTAPVGTSVSAPFPTFTYIFGDNSGGGGELTLAPKP